MGTVQCRLDTSSAKVCVARSGRFVRSGQARAHVSPDIALVVEEPYSPSSETVLLATGPSSLTTLGLWVASFLSPCWARFIMSEQRSMIREIGCDNFKRQAVSWTNPVNASKEKEIADQGCTPSLDELDKFVILKGREECKCYFVRRRLAELVWGKIGGVLWLHELATIQGGHRARIACVRIAKGGGKQYLRARG